MNLYSEHYVTPKAERFVNKIWCLDNSIGESLIENKLVLPNGCFNLAIVSGNAIEVHTSKNKYEMNEGVYFCSQMTNKVLVNIQPKTKVTIMQLHSWTLSMYPKYDLSNFSDSIIKITARLRPKKIIIVSSAPQIRYPDCYGIDMSKLGDFVAFQAMILGREAMSGQHCMLCQLSQKQFNQNKDKVGLPWTYDDLVHIGTEICTE